jgi:hypothetical protein
MSHVHGQPISGKITHPFFADPGQMPLHHAVAQGHLHMINELLGR